MTQVDYFEKVSSSWVELNPRTLEFSELTWIPTWLELGFFHYDLNFQTFLNNWIAAKIFEIIIFLFFPEKFQDRVEMIK